MPLKTFWSTVPACFICRFRYSTLSQLLCCRIKRGVEGAGGATVATQGSPDFQETTTKQNSTVCIKGVNKIATNFVTLVATYIHVAHLFKDLSA
jgi:hypothetical protein